MARAHHVVVVLLTILCLAARAAGAQEHDPIEIHLAGGTFRPLEETHPASADDRAESARGFRYLVVVTHGPLDTPQRQRLRAVGAELLDYLPRHAYRVRLRGRDEAAVRRLPFVAWLGELPPDSKIQPALASRARTATEAVRLRVLLFAGEDEHRVLALLAGSPTLAAPSGHGGAWRVDATVQAVHLERVLSELAALPEVEAIEAPPRLHLLNQDAVWVHQSFVGPSPQETPIFARGIFGCGQVVAVADTGQDFGACFFADTVHGAPPIARCALAPCPAVPPALDRRKDILYYNWSGTPDGDDDTCPATLGPSGHGTHTSGSVAADRSPYADCAGFTTPARNGGDGQAPGARLIIQELGDGLEYLNARGGTMWNLADVAVGGGARIHSNSWGGACYDMFGTCTPGCTMPYESYARDADLAMWTHPDLLVVTAAGNAGLYCPPPVAVGTPSNAKNVLSVGSVGHGTSAQTPSVTSSSGPTEDGRLKPTVAAQGESVVSAASDADAQSANCTSCSLDGSSMSSPTAAGLAALVREYYTAGFLASGARTPAQGFAPTGALVKATLIDGAVALSAAAPSADFESGFGRIVLGDTLAFAGSPFALRVDDHRAGIGTGAVVTHAYDVAAGTPFRATLVWTDYPGALGAAVARVNELKLEVTDPAGVTWFQTLGPEGLPRPTSDPADLHDTRNVEERLVFSAPLAGRWVVRVRGVDVPWGPQPFALVVRGALSDCPAPAAPAAPSLATPADHQVLVSWSAVPGATSYTVFRSHGPCPAGPWVPVAEAVPGTSFLDTGVSGGTTYAYRVSAASDPAGACQSSPSPCGSVVPTGDCFLPPSFRGVRAATSAGLAACTVTVSWDAAAPYCGGDVRYNVYRSTTSGFTPGAATRVARCVAGTQFQDGVDLASGVPHFYVVRAEDAASGHGGPCRDGNEDANTVEAVAAASGPPVLSTFTDDAGDTGTASFTAGAPWTVEPTGGRTGPAVYAVASSEGVCADLISPVLSLGSPGDAPQLTFHTRHDLDYDPFGIFGAEGSIGQVEIATAPLFQDWTRVLLTPDYPRVVEFPYNFCPTTGEITRYFTGTDLTWRSYTGSLVNWGGGDVKVRFHLSGDLIYPYGDWWVDDLSITKVSLPGPCTTAAAGPPPVPDVRVGKSGSDVTLAWDPNQCPAAAVNVYRGTIGSYAAFTTGWCGLPATGAATLPIPAGSWFLVVATNGSDTDGSWSRTHEGEELTYGGASAVCPAILHHVTNNGCP